MRAKDTEHSRKNTGEFGETKATFLISEVPGKGQKVKQVARHQRNKKPQTFPSDVYLKALGRNVAAFRRNIWDGSCISLRSGGCIRPRGQGADGPGS